MSLVYGIGINDCKGWSNKEKLLSTDIRYRTYGLWHHMLMRAYSEKFHSQCPTYKGVTVCERWHTLSKFAEDLPKVKGFELWRDNPKKHICLDKDTLVTGNKEYCLDKCIFLTKEESSRDVFNRHKEYLKSPEIKEKNVASRRKPVICTYPDGTEKMFLSATHAEKEGGFTRRYVQRCCVEPHRTNRGCKFRYA